MDQIVTLKASVSYQFYANGYSVALFTCTSLLHSSLLSIMCSLVRCYKPIQTGIKILQTMNNTILINTSTGAWGSVVVKALRYYSDGPRIDPRWCDLEFFPWVLPTKPCALRSTQPLKMSTRDFSWGKGGRCVWLTTYHPCSAESRDDPGP